MILRAMSISACVLWGAWLLSGCGGSGSQSPEIVVPPVVVPEMPKEFIRAGEAKGNRFFTDRKGNKLFGGKTWYNTHTFWKGYCVVSQMVDGVELNGVINEKGEEVIPCVHKEYLDNSEEGYFKIRNPRIGYLDSTGNLVIPMEYTKSMGVQDGMVKLEKDYRKWGMLNMKGEVIIPFEYEKIGPWENGLARVSKTKGKWGYVNRKGEVVIPMEYSDATHFSMGVALVAKGKKYGLIDTLGQPITDFVFDNFEYIVDVVKNEIDPSGFSETNKRLVMEEGYIIVSKNGLWGYIDRSGKEVIPCQYDHIYVMERDGSVMIRKGEKRGNYKIKEQKETWYD